jgi:hypothetical protein
LHSALTKIHCGYLSFLLAWMLYNQASLSLCIISLEFKHRLLSST